MVQHTTIALTKPVPALEAQRLEHTLWLTPGVWLVCVNPVTATAYLEHENDQCTTEARIFLNSAASSPSSWRVPQVSRVT